jgi:mannose-6-phosphate isomerase-like protein (cupin superfamily)
MRVELDVHRPALLRPGEGETITDRPERTLRILADRGELTLTWFRYEPGEEGPEPHIHRRHTDAFFVLGGELEFGLGPEVQRLTGGAGTLAAAPANVVHTFRNAGDETAVFLNIHAPSMGFGEMLRARRDGREEVHFDQFEPPPDGGRPFEDAIVRGPGEGDTIEMGSSTALFKLEGTDGDGTFSLSETTIAPGFPGPLPHRHRGLVDSFFVLAGILTVRLGDEHVEAGPGSFAFVPPGTIHSFSNPTDEPVRMLNLMAPGGFEQYLREAHAASASDPAALAEIASRYDFELA